MAFSKRPGGYKAGVCVLLVGVVVFCVGFATPYWNVAYVEYRSYFAYDITRFNSGLWVSCTASRQYLTMKICGSQMFFEKPGWFKAIQGMQCISLISSLAALIYFLFVNFINNNNNTISIARTGELTAGIGGAPGLIGLIVYAVKHAKIAQESKRQIPSDSHLSWSFYVDLVGLLLIFVSAVVVGVSNKPCRPDDMALRYIPAQQTVVVPYPGQTAVNFPVCITAATGNPVFTAYPATSYNGYNGYITAPQP